MEEQTRHYRVLWEIDVEASSPHEAARQALDIQRSPHSTATVFSVMSDTTHQDKSPPLHTIDLSEGTDDVEP